MPQEDDYAPYYKPSTGKNSLAHYHDTDLFDTPSTPPPPGGWVPSKWHPDKWTPPAWLPDLPFLPAASKKPRPAQHPPDGKRGRVLITGGTGSLGIPLVDRLLKDGFAVTLHDIRDPLPRDTEYIRQRNPSATRGGRLAFVKGDVASVKHVAALLREMLVPTTEEAGKNVQEGTLRAGRGLVGIIHLAGVSRDIWCSSRPAECQRLNVKGTTNLFDALADATEFSQDDDAGRPWFLHLSSLDVYDPSTHTLPAPADSLDGLTALGKSQLLAERALEKSYTSHRARLPSPAAAAAAGIRTLILRPSTIYGHPTDTQDRLVPALVRGALADLPVQVVHGNQEVDFLEVRDALDGVLGAVERLMGRDDEVDEQVSEQGIAQEAGFDEKRNRRREVQVPRRRGPMFETYDLVSGYTATPRQLLSMIMRLTHSVSPIQDYTTHHSPSSSGRTMLPLMSVPPSPALLRAKLGFTAAVPLDQGVAAYVSTVRQSVLDWGKDYLGAECPGSSVYGDPAVIHDADRRNRNLQRLAGCTANIGVNHDGWIHHVKCGDSVCEADNVKTSSFNWNQSIFTVLPHGSDAESGASDDAGGSKWGWAFGLLTGERKERSAGPTRVQFVEGNTQKVLGFTRKDAPEGMRQYVKLGLFDPEDAANRSEVVTVFEPRVSLAGL